ncbi:hypothetical protein ASZ90_016654 [hydrocarbon metagenome]|uniref:Uncharacterized protein n=1 Tax=hydrocarbon metagenome TaxID=938273 RepID=A0A0W8EL88_9ZZZZ
MIRGSHIPREHPSGNALLSSAGIAREYTHPPPYPSGCGAGRGEYPPSLRESGRTWKISGSLILAAVCGASLLSCSLQEVLLCGEGENQ